MESDIGKFGNDDIPCQYPYSITIPNFNILEAIYEQWIDIDNWFRNIDLDISTQRMDIGSLTDFVINKTEEGVKVVIKESDEDMTTFKNNGKLLKAK